MTHVPFGDEGVEWRNLAGGSQIAIPGVVSGVAVLRTVTFTNSESRDVSVEVAAAVRLRTETVADAVRTEMEGRFTVGIDTGILFGAATDYVEIHFPGSNTVASSVWGFSAAEAILVGDTLQFAGIVPAGGARTFTISYVTTAVPENMRTAGGLGYVECFNIDAKLERIRESALDVVIS